MVLISMTRNILDWGGCRGFFGTSFPTTVLYLYSSAGSVQPHSDLRFSYFLFLNSYPLKYSHTAFQWKIALHAYSSSISKRRFSCDWFYFGSILAFFELGFQTAPSGVLPFSLFCFLPPYRSSYHGMISRLLDIFICFCRPHDSTVQSAKA
jgi:hypothetical protein